MLQTTLESEHYSVSIATLSYLSFYVTAVLYVAFVACYLSASCLLFVDVLCIICVFWFSQIVCCFLLPLLFCTLVC